MKFTDLLIDNPEMPRSSAWQGHYELDCQLPTANWSDFRYRIVPCNWYWQIQAEVIIFISNDFDVTICCMNPAIRGQIRDHSHLFALIRVPSKSLYDEDLWIIY